MGKVPVRRQLGLGRRAGHLLQGVGVRREHGRVLQTVLGQYPQAPAQRRAGLRLGERHRRRGRVGYTATDARRLGSSSGDRGDSGRGREGAGGEDEVGGGGGGGGGTIMLTPMAGCNTYKT